MQDLKSAGQSKEKILSVMRLRGPSLPVQVAKAAGSSPLFASAFLSELKSEGKVKISNMRVGSSPLYYLSGQEELLENFYQYLNHREKEAFSLLKQEKILDDEKQEPVVRVALRAIKDFAIPVRVKINGDSKLFWKFFSVSDSEVGGILSGEKSVGEIVVPPVQEKSEEVVSDKTEEIEKEMESRIPESLKGVEKKIRKKLQETEFGKNVREYLLAKDIEILEILAERKKDFEAKVRIDTLFGKQIYYLVAKDKRSFTDNDLAVALKKAQFEKLPALGMSSGELHRKGKEYLREWGNLVKFERMSL